jgi:hypothetical protein
MADQLERNTRAPNPDVENDDPLAELARIIGYERPEDAGSASPVAREAEASTFDLESELMRELDVLPLDSFDEFDEDEGLRATPAADAAGPARDVSAENPPLDDGFEFDASWLDNKPGEALDTGFDDSDGSPKDDIALTQTADSADDDDSDFELDLEQGGKQPLETIQAVATAPVVAESDQGIAQSPANPSPDVSDDDVLADIFRYELPNHSPAAPSAPPVSAEAAAGEDAATDDVIAPQALGSAGDWTADDRVVGRPVDDADATVDISADDAAGPAPAGLEELRGGDAPAAIDFEDYLSAELDMFEHQVGMGPTDEGPFDADDLPDYPAVSDSQPAGPESAGPDEDAELDASAAGGADLQPDEPYALEDEFLFDEAAEDLLADIAQDEAIARADFEGDLSDDSLEAGISEEISDELEDLFAASEPEPVADTGTVDDVGELEFDLEQALAQVVIDSGPDAEDHFLDDREPVPAAAPALSGAVGEPGAEQDEMAEAFKELMAEGSAAGRADAAVLSSYRIHDDGVAGDPADSMDGDWLSGIETGQVAKAGLDHGVAADDGFHFDATMITEPEETVEAMGDIDVPGLPDDEPQMVAPDFDSEIEREFAGILDPEIASADTHAPLASVTDHDDPSRGSAAWGQEADAGVRREAYDDYAALERELGDSDIDVSPPYAKSGSEMRSPEALGGEYASGLNAAGAADQGGARGPVVALAVLGLAVLAGVGAFGWSMMSGGDGAVDDGPRIIRADREPVKVLPENPGGVTVPNQDKAVYDRVAGGDGAQSGQPALVNTAEEPVDVVQRTLDPDVLPLEGRNEVPADKSEERLTAGGSGDVVDGAGAGAPVVSPRRVRTMVVRPDGSIVAREDPEPETAAPAAEPTAEVAQQQPAEPVQETAAAVEPAQTAPAVPAPVEDSVEVAQAASTGQTASEGTIAPVRVVTTQPIRAPVPQSRPAEQPVDVVGTVTQGGNVAAPAATAPAAPTQPVEVASAPAAPVANPGGYYVQIASQPTAEGAQASWQTLSNRYSSVIGGRSVEIQRADIPGKGVFHRVRIPAGERDEANALCTRYKAAGGSCFVSR